MNNTQRRLVIAALVVIGLVLAFIFLDWGRIAGVSYSRILVFYERPNPYFPNLLDPIGIYTRYGVAGILLGVVAPLCLFAAAAFVALGARK
jgi:hypothetical protein